MQLLTWLAGAGARTSSGAPVASGRLWAYEPGGGTTTANVYSDVDGTVIATQPVTLDASGRAVLYAAAPVRILVQDATGITVLDVDQANVSRAEAVQVDNTGWTDGYLNGVLEAIYASTGGTDAMYRESSGATRRTIKGKFSELSISVKDFGAAGDGLAVDTTAIQAAINRVGFLGGGEVYFPPGTYLIDQTLTNAVDGVSLRGAGRTATIIKLNSTTLNGMSFTGCDGFYVRDFQLQTSTASSGTGIAMATCTDCAISGVFVTAFYVSAAMTSCSRMTIDGGRLRSPSAAAASGRSLTLTDTSSIAVRGTLLDTFGASSYGVELLGSTSGATFSCWFTSTGTSVRFDSALTGVGFRFFGCSFSIGTAYFSFAGTTMPGAFFQAGNGIDGYKGTLLSGATFTPDLSRGYSFTIDCTTTGSANVVAVPTPPPAATDYGVYIDITYYAHAGGALTGGSGLAAGYHVSTAASLVDTNRTHFRFRWDPDASVWRECSRSVTT